MKTPTTVLLVAIAALLAVNLIPATAQQPPPFNPDSEPTVVGIAVYRGGSSSFGPFIYRIWSDGTVEENHKAFICGPGN